MRSNRSCLAARVALAPSDWRPRRSQETNKPRARKSPAEAGPPAPDQAPASAGPLLQRSQRSSAKGVLGVSPLNLGSSRISADRMKAYAARPCPKAPGLLSAEDRDPGHLRPPWLFRDSAGSQAALASHAYSWVRHTFHTGPLRGNSAASAPQGADSLAHRVARGTAPAGYGRSQISAGPYPVSQRNPVGHGRRALRCRRTAGAPVANAMGWFPLGPRSKRSLGTSRHRSRVDRAAPPNRGQLLYPRLGGGLPPGAVNSAPGPAVAGHMAPGPHSCAGASGPGPLSQPAQWPGSTLSSQSTA